MAASLHHLHTYFFFPFSIDKEFVCDEHGEHWKKYSSWIEGLDDYIASQNACARAAGLGGLGVWRRTTYTRSDMDAAAYQDMVFFHPFVRRIFFDTSDDASPRGERETLIRCYTIPVNGQRRVWLRAEDTRGRAGALQVTDLRLFLFANGMGILSIGTEAWNLGVKEALWVNETMRKIYPSSGRQIREGRGPCRVALSLENQGLEEVIAEERFQDCRIVEYQPPLSRVIQSLLYFLDYEKQQYEQLLDERMILYCYAAIDPSSVPADFIGSESYEILLSRFLYVDHLGADYRYDPEFTRAQMREHVYRRWVHEGTYYGSTSYSNITLTMGELDRGEHAAKEGFLIHRMFDSRYYLMALVALFYRATLLDFAQKTALVSRRLYRDQETGTITRENIQIAKALRSEFLHFCNYWYFDELANKDEEIEHFALQCRAYRIGAMKTEAEQEIEKLNTSLYQHNQERSTEAVNRLAMLSMIMGAGAVATGIFGMNFGGAFDRWFFNPGRQEVLLHWAAVIGVLAMALGALAFGVYLVAANTQDYRDILIPQAWQARHRRKWYSLKKSV